ncbi:myotubularin-related protein 8 isoform X2 [Cimex lectularius]|uniref:phosphatidylinositol-3,5-bisphosphate 3-phosphatase n=1 Tax=Cimex lectularius TaxID=79782 RepID=A0A8I6SPQ1_CIMLE|nr:myotubularin-related protein 8 isoform X2 [Cimex lectularius]
MNILNSFMPYPGFHQTTTHEETLTFLRVETLGTVVAMISCSLFQARRKLIIVNASFYGCIENVRMLDRYNARKLCFGNLFVTATHLIFVETETNKETWILLLHIASVEKLPISTSGCPLQIRCKTFHSVTFVIPRERACHDVYSSLLKLSQLEKVEDLFCFRSSNCENIPKTAGWNFFDLQAEFQRMRVPNEQWSLTLLNKDYELCDTYPSLLFVPSTANTTILTGSSKFRSKGRLPVLTYLHKNKAAICRCSQPLSGFNARCLEDEQMLNCIIATNPTAPHMVVVDTRPLINAMANRAKGKGGYENENFYDNIKFSFMGIENIHVMRNGLMKLIETCELKWPSMSGFLSGLESSGWLKHIKSILDTSWFIAQAVESGVNVLVHCSDGWDRTAQVCSLAAMLLDPFYRTIQGFQALIEKDWLSFGHKFTDRIGHLAGETKEVSPVFTQFIECTWQLMEDFPTAFQFNESFLFAIHDNTSSCLYGTFIGNCEKERIELRLSERTFSLWGFMANHMREYINPLYNPKFCEGVLRPNLIPQNIRFWRGMYCRFESGVHPRESVSESLLVASNHSNSLEEHIKLLQKKINALTKLLSDPQGKKMYEKINSASCTGNKVNEQEDVLKNAVPLVKSNPFDLNKKSIDSLSDDLTALALDWKTLRNVKCFECTAPSDHSMYHCWQCGNIFCTRCIEKHITLPGHLSQCAVPVCHPCYQKLNRSSSAETP